VGYFWSDIRNFESREWRKDWHKVDLRLVRLVDEWTSFAKTKFATSCIINVAWDDDGHQSGSWHFTGMAVDCFLVGVPLIHQWQLAERFPFTGIGLYPFWKNPGLHLDIRPQSGSRSARWWRDEENMYIDFDDKLMKILLGEFRAIP